MQITTYLHFFYPKLILIHNIAFFTRNFDCNNVKSITFVQNQKI